jgi:protein-disulfide isomerase
MKSLHSMAALGLTAILSFQGCLSAKESTESRLQAIEARQDSILTMLRAIGAQSEFVALRVGWRPPADNTPKVIPVGTSFTKGPADAVVTIVEFSDLECPYCAQVVPVLDSLVKVYPKDVRIVYKHFPLSFHPNARDAAAAAIAAGNQGRFFEYRTRISPRFRSLSDSLYLATARAIGLDMARFQRERVRTPEINALLDRDMALGQEIGVEGTPTLFVNGRLAEDRSYEYFAAMVERAKRARK